MFTNWLTGTSGSGNGTNNSNSNSNTTVRTATAVKDCAEEPLSQRSVALNRASIGCGGGGIAVTSVPPPGAITVTTPPDVLLEVGPAPASVRFMAHSLVLGMHSGYLRSAIRLDETPAATALSLAVNGETVLYLANVTAEQFAPLLSYMYTGYLELTVENIFGVLLATHLLHMPRALEICRSFLARAQTEGFLSDGAPPPADAFATTSLQKCSSGKVIRPIPSKATLPNYGFMPLAIGPSPASQSQSQPLANAVAATVATYSASQASPDTERLNEPRDEIDVEQHSESSRSTGLAVAPSQPDIDEDEEVFIDSNSETDFEAAAPLHASRRDTVTTNAAPRTPQADIAAASDIAIASTDVKSLLEKSTIKPRSASERAVVPKSASAAKRLERRRSGACARQKSAGGSSGTASGLQVVKAPVPASQLDAVEDSNCRATPKVIIDVASCDGPVRFRRILNAAYGHKLPDAYAAMALQERTQQSVSLSFHQQMAKTISQQQQQLQHAEESENSESSSERAAGKQAAFAAGGAPKPHDLYVCVYCKHTFKSQYCYQKHAKRHLNPLSLSCANVGATLNEETIATTTANSHSDTTDYSAVSSAVNALKGVAANTLAAAGGNVLCEMRPLDMNVQYYPCKTCGSKFPSYYFVHKHRKLCHADDEEAAASMEMRGSGGGSRSASQVGSNSVEGGPTSVQQPVTPTNPSSDILEKQQGM